MALTLALCLHQRKYSVPGGVMPKFVVSVAEQVLGEFPVTKDRMTIGGKASNDIQIENVNADGEHAVITRCGDLYVIEDLGSANGTFVHGQKIAKLLLSGDDVITVGRCDIRFVEEDVQRGNATSSAEKKQVPDSNKSAKTPHAPPPPVEPAANGKTVIVMCPHCAYKRQPKDAKLPKDKCPSCGLSYTVTPALMTAESTSGDRLEVYEERVVIKRKMGIKVLLQSLKGDLLEGIKGDKIIPFDSIASIQFKAASTLLSGYITFVLPESKEGFKLAGLDEYTVEFVKKEEPKFLKIKNFLDAKIS